MIAMRREEFNECLNIWRYDDFMAAALGYTGFDRELYREFVPLAFKMVLESVQADPVSMYEEIVERIREEWPLPTALPVHGGWHHFLVPGILLAALRNSGNMVTDDHIREGLHRGAMSPGGGCGFHGVCGAAVGLGILISVLGGANPLTDETRSTSMRISAKAIGRVESLGGPRCCALSTYTVINLGVKELRNRGYKLPEPRMAGRCPYHEINDECHHEACPYYPRPER